MMSHQYPPSALVVAFGVTLMLAACTGCSTGDSPDTAAAPPTDVGQTATTQPPATTTTAPTTTAAPATTSTTSAWDALPPNVKAGDWHTDTYESIGYTCGSGQPDYVCDAPHPVQYTNAWIGNDGPEIAMDFIDFFGSYDPEVDISGGHDPESEQFPPDSPALGLMVGSVDDATMADVGHGIRVTQLDRAPPGLDIGGEAWIRLTISSLSAVDRAEASGKLVPTEVGYRIEAGSEGNPLDMRGPKRWPTDWIESIVLVATNDTMSQWIISFNQPGTYTYAAGYWGTGSGYALMVRFVRL